MQFESNAVTLKDISEITDEGISVKKHRCFFNIPIYQRLYVWGDAQVKTLLEDLKMAFLEKKDLFYLGGVLVVEQKTDTCDNQVRHYDLIDGQQRFTTLWLLSIILGDGLSNFTKEISHKSIKERIRFSIRPEISEYFHTLLRGKKNLPTAPEEAVHIENALAAMNSFLSVLKTENIDIAKFTNFIYQKVQVVFTIVPEQTDLNKLFEVINNRGVQLKHHEILKAQLLAKLDTDDKVKYGILWDACSFMDDFVEKNLHQATTIKIANLYDNEQAKLDSESLADASKVIEAITAHTTANECEAKSLEAILSGNVNIGNEDDIAIAEEEFESDAIRSIISFPMLLQHTLRIWLFKNKKRDLPKILEKDLLKLFNDHWLKYKAESDIEGVTVAEVKEFIELLWEIRYLFDKYIIKWIKGDEEEFQGIRQLRKQPSSSNKSIFYLTREAPDNYNRGFVLLQSMLYHSQQLTTHYWLTPLLNFIHQTKDEQSSRVDYFYGYLRHLDNHLLSSIDDGALIDRTRNFMQSSWYCASGFNTGILDKPLGVEFPHYWFYKTEFVLWYQRNNLTSDDEKRWSNFRFTAKNSVEHISPQTAREYDTNTVSEMVLNTFGNLALVSRSINSEYSNKPYNEKQQHFRNKNVNSVDSLKMDLIYRNEVWNDFHARQHQETVLSAIDTYFKERIL